MEKTSKQVLKTKKLFSKLYITYAAMEVRLKKKILFIKSQIFSLWYIKENEIKKGRREKVDRVAHG